MVADEIRRLLIELQSPNSNSFRILLGIRRDTLLRNDGYTF